MILRPPKWRDIKYCDNNIGAINVTIIPLYTESRQTRLHKATQGYINRANLHDPINVLADNSSNALLSAAT